MATRYRVETLEGEQWVTLESGPDEGGGSHVHGGLGWDTRHCYRVTAWALFGQQKTSTTACAYTKDGLILRNIWRVQLRLTTGDVANADTDDDIRVGVFGPINGESGGGTWLDSDGDDFERGATHSYDLINLTGISELGDIEAIEIHKTGDNSWCLQNATLLVNDEPVFSTGFGDPCQWTNTGFNEYTSISHDQLHDYPLWGKRTSTSGLLAGYTIPFETMLDGNYATLVIHRDHLEGRIESQVGDAMHGNDAYWAPHDAVEVARWDSQRSKVDLDLKASAPGGDPDVDVDFDMVVGTHRDAIGKWFVDINVENGNADIFPAWYQWLGLSLTAGFQLDSAERKIELALDGIAEQVGIAEIWRVTAMFDNEANLIITGTLACEENGPTATCIDFDDLPPLEPAP